MKRKKSTRLATEWFSKYLKLIITDREARAFLAQLPAAVQDLHRLARIVASEKTRSRTFQNSAGKGRAGGR